MTDFLSYLTTNGLGHWFTNMTTILILLFAVYALSYALITGIVKVRLACDTLLHERKIARANGKA